MVAPLLPLFYFLSGLLESLTVAAENTTSRWGSSALSCKSTWWECCSCNLLNARARMAGIRSLSLAAGAELQNTTEAWQKYDSRSNHSRVICTRQHSDSLGTAVIRPIRSSLPSAVSVAFTSTSFACLDHDGSGWIFIEDSLVGASIRRIFEVSC